MEKLEMHLSVVYRLFWFIFLADSTVLKRQYKEKKRPRIVHKVLNVTVNLLIVA